MIWLALGLAALLVSVRRGLGRRHHVPRLLPAPHKIDRPPTRRLHGGDRITVERDGTVTTMEVHEVYGPPTADGRRRQRITLHEIKRQVDVYDLHQRMREAGIRRVEPTTMPGDGDDTKR